MNNPQQNEADIVGGIKKFFRKLPASAEKAESKFTNELIQSITGALQRAEDFDLLTTTPSSTNYQQRNLQYPTNVTYGQQAPAAQPQATSQPQATAKPQTRAEPTIPPPEPQVSQPLTFAGKKYTKGPKGWVDDKGKLADENTTKILNQAQAKANQPDDVPFPNIAVARPNQSIARSNKSKKRRKMRENTYFDKLNDLFEGIVSLQEGNLAVSDFITNRWFGPWARSIATKNPNVNLLDQNIINQVKKFAKEIESSYASDKGVNGVRKLADYLTNTYYDIVNQSGQRPSSAPQAAEPSQTTSAPTSTQPRRAALSTDNMSDWAKSRFGSGGAYDIDEKKVEKYFDTLYQRDPNTVNKIIKKFMQKYRVF